jgi:hypothetical protein
MRSCGWGLFALLSVAAVHAQTPNYDGFLDVASCDQIAGWAWNSNQSPEGPVSVDFYMDGNQSSGVLIGTTSANLYRYDLWQAGKGNGYHSFSFPAPAILKDGKTHYVNAYVTGSGFALHHNTTFSLNCSIQSPYYTYDEVAKLTPTLSDPGNWTAHGTLYSSGAGGSYIANPQYIHESSNADGTDEYEIRSTLLLNTYGGGYFDQYVRASQDAWNQSGGGGGTYFLIEMSNPVFGPTGCTATLAHYEVVNGAFTLLTSATVVCQSSMQIRTVVYSNLVATLIGGQVYISFTTLTRGQPGFGSHDAPSGSIAEVDIGPRNYAPPLPISRQTVGTSSFPDKVDIHWTEPVDVTGVGILENQIFRDDGAGGTFNWYGGTFLGSDYTDAAVSPGRTYLYG